MSLEFNGNKQLLFPISIVKSDHIANNIASHIIIRCGRQYNIQDPFMETVRIAKTVLLILLGTMISIVAH